MNRSPYLYTATFLIAGSVLLMEVALTRVLSVMAWHHYSALIVGVALLGNGAAGTLLALRAPSGTGQSWNFSTTAALCLGYAASLVVCLALMTRVSMEPLRLTVDLSQGLSLLAYYLLMLVPFFLGGLALSRIITGAGEDIHAVYFADLAGAAAGALLSIPALRWLGATNAVLAAAVVAAAAGLLLYLHARAPYGMALRVLLAAGLLLVGGLMGQPYLVHVPASKDIFPLVNIFKGTDALDSSAWNEIARIDVIRPRMMPLGGYGGGLAPAFQREWPQMEVFQDGGAPTGMVLVPQGDVGRMTFLAGYLQALPYVVHPKPERGVVIGVGGGPDVLIGLFHGARHIHAVEINPVTVHNLKVRYRDFLGGVFDRPDVTLVNAEGRHFVAASSGTFDTIQLSGVDTFAAASAGALALAESHVYTLEGVKDFWNHLTPTGVLSYSRWLFDPPRETLRLAVTLRQALDDLGIPTPEKHLAIVKFGSAADTILSRAPLTPAQLEAIRAWATERGFEVLFDPERPQDNTFNHMLRATPEQRAALMDAYFFEVHPSTDDEPFFFNYYKWENALTLVDGTGGYITTQFPMGLLVVAWSLLQLTFLAVLGILLPLGRKQRAKANAPGMMLYFGALGLGFIFTEVMLMQKLTLVVGGPTLSLAFTLTVILLSSALGSLWSARLDVERPRTLAQLAVVLPLLLLCGVGALHVLTPRLVGASMLVSLLGAGLVAAPLAFVLGIPFPVGMRVLQARLPEWTPWAWAVNAFTTVVGSVLSLLCGMTMGFTATGVVAACIYAGGLWSILRLRAVPRLHP